MGGGSSSGAGIILIHLVENYWSIFHIIRVKNGFGIIWGKCPKHKADSAGMVSSLENSKSGNN